jgi:hypothetical protein
MSTQTPTTNANPVAADRAMRVLVDAASKLGATSRIALNREAPLG